MWRKFDFFFIAILAASLSMEVSTGNSDVESPEILQKHLGHLDCACWIVRDLASEDFKEEADYFLSTLGLGMICGQVSSEEENLRCQRELVGRLSYVYEEIMSSIREKDAALAVDITAHITEYCPKY